MLYHRASGSICGIQVVLPVPRGPSKMNERLGSYRRRVYIASIFTVKMLPVYTAL